MKPKMSRPFQKVIIDAVIMCYVAEAVLMEILLRSHLRFEMIR